MSVELTSVSKKTEEGLGKENAAFDNGEIDKRSQDVENNSKASFLKQFSLPVCLSVCLSVSQDRSLPNSWQNITSTCNMKYTVTLFHFVKQTKFF